MEQANRSVLIQRYGTPSKARVFLIEGYREPREEVLQNNENKQEGACEILKWKRQQELAQETHYRKGEESIFSKPSKMCCGKWLVSRCQEVFIFVSDMIQEVHVNFWATDHKKLRVLPYSYLSRICTIFMMVQILGKYE